MNRRIINDFIRASFCPHDESRILNSMLNIAGNGIQYLYHKKLFDTLTDRIVTENKDWFFLTLNGYYDLTIYNWSMLFGSYSEPTHYRHLLDHASISGALEQILSIEHMDLEILKHYFLNCLELNNEEYKKFHNEVKNYRNRFLAHREHSPLEIDNGELIYPELKIIQKSLEALYLLLIKVITTFPQSPDGPNKYKVSYLLMSSHVNIEEFAQHTFPNFDNLFDKPI